MLDRILTLLHPFMPFVTEELWNGLGRERETDLILAIGQSRMMHFQTQKRMPKWNG